MTARQYDLVVFGATGYTGKLTAEHIATHLPTDLRWALAGRSESKLKDVAAECKALNPDRSQPDIEICNLDDSELVALAKKTTLLVATIGPYALYGEYAFKACAQNGTHYLDVTGEVPFVADMINKYEKDAKASGAIMIPQIGIESSPADLVTWSLVKMIRERLSAATAEVVLSVHEFSGTPSGGTLNSVLTFLDVYNLQQIRSAFSPFAISPKPGPKAPGKSLMTRALGICEVRDLGILTSSIGGMADAPIVQRSWGLLDYGPNFHFSEYAKARNYLTGIAFHFGLLLGSLLLSISPLRQVMRRFVTQPGGGATKEEAKKDRLDYRAIGTPDRASKPRAFCRAYYMGGFYELTGIFLSHAAITILRDEHDLSGGVYTPACLGQKFIDRLEPVGFKFEKKWYED